MRFASDNTAPVAPEIMAALARVNEGCAPGYGADDVTAEAARKLRDVLEAPEAAVHFVTTGTAANALALASICPPWGAIYCHRYAHAEEDECGAPEFYTSGAKTVLIEGENARMTPESLKAAIAWTTRVSEKNVHNVQKGALTITQATERGAVYPVATIAELASIARGAGIPVHLDGARFANAVARLGCTPAEMTWKAGVDILTFGATKNGAMGAEAVVIFDPARAWEFELRRKRGGHLMSKMRYVAAQVDALLTDGLWLDLAARANRAAARLSDGLAALGAVRLVHPVEANMLYIEAPRAARRHRPAVGAQYFF